ncbi:MAG: response regulator transcription factor [Burkholderiales bacterium]|nr:response regulator transcription factor [Burkholderiales bacterium]
MRVLLVEDNSSLAYALTQALRQRHVFADSVPAAELAARAIDEHEYDALVLDLGLPGESGTGFLARLRRGPHRGLPVLVLTSRGAVRERVETLNLGADDYMVKPCDADELAARLHAIARRSRGQVDEILAFRDIAVDRARRQVLRAGAPVRLTRHEFRILEFLLERRGRVQSRRQIEDALYGWGEAAESNSIEVHVHNLRRKLGESLIETVRGAGYRAPEH